MGFLDWLWKSSADQGPDIGLDVVELARRLRVPEEELRGARARYRSFEIPKAAGGHRTIHAPDDPTRALQRRIHRAVLRGLKSHPTAHGFERGRSIATNAAPHAGRSVVVRMDLERFFDSTRPARVEALFRAAGWNREATKILVDLTTDHGGLPQGAPTSPRLSNLVNFRLDGRLEGLARSLGAAYTRYADDMTFSFAEDAPDRIHSLVRAVKKFVAEDGYRLHQGAKLSIRRRHQRQVVTGLVVNDRPRLPRKLRRWLRAVEHRARVAPERGPTLAEAQIAGWRAFRQMIDRTCGASGG